MAGKRFLVLLAGCLLALCAACAERSAQGSGGEEQAGVESAGQRDASLEYNLGVRYHKGEGLPQDYAKALEWYGKAAEKGEAEAEFNLGVMYYYGQGVARSKYIAKEWFGRACEHGDEDACARHRHLNEQGY
ncbi:MAG: sel1 repeat family protein [Desulfovibrionaceae bacterium]|nr:sel1 repeat family protein [Desulfovibrionaceae bacterium]MBO4794331.1 sel1 repeat family protein [Deltaproteobacteria bacterium]